MVDKDSSTTSLLDFEMGEKLGKPLLSKKATKLFKDIKN